MVGVVGAVNIIDDFKRGKGGAGRARGQAACMPSRLHARLRSQRGCGKWRE